MLPTANDTLAEFITVHLAVTLTAVAVRDPCGGYSIAVPALPGCVSEAEDLNEVTKDIREAAEGWLLAMHRKNLPEVLVDLAGTKS